MTVCKRPIVVNLFVTTSLNPMKKVILRICLVFCGASVFSASSVFAQFSLVGELRPRAEFRNGFKTLSKEGADAAFFVEQRSRLYAHYKHEKFAVGITLQDVRIWGSVSQIYKDDPSLTNLAEAWAAYFFNEKFSVKLGRQMLAYDNQRILGSLDWAQQSRSHDLMLIKYEDSTFQLHLGAAFNQDANTPEYGKLTSTYYSGVNNYKTLQYLWGHKDFKGGGVSLLFLNNGIQSGPDSAASVYFSQTAGGILTKNIGKVTVQAELYHQFGENGKGVKVNANLLAASLSFPVRTVKMTVGADYLSGTNYDETGKDQSFNPLYGTHHKFYGFMDYFYVGSPHLQNGKTTGLVDVYLNPVFKIAPKASLAAFVHQFFSPTNIYPGGVPDLSSSAPAKSNLGTELDLVLSLKLHDDVNLNVGYSHLFATESMKAIKNGGDGNLNNWAWLMVAFKPRLL